MKSRIHPGGGALWVVFIFLLLCLSACSTTIHGALEPVSYGGNPPKPIEDTYFTLNPVDFLFQVLPDYTWTSEINASGIYTKTALVQKVRTSNAISNDSIDLSSAKKKGGMILLLIVPLILGSIWLSGVFQVKGGCANAFLVGFILMLLGLIVWAFIEGFTRPSSDIYFDNAADSACVVHIDQKSFSVPSQTYTKVKLDNGDHSLGINCGEDLDTSSETAIHVEKSKLAIYNISGLNSYTLMKGQYTGGN